MTKERETVEEFLARGGKIDKIEPGICKECKDIKSLTRIERGWKYVYEREEVERILKTSGVQ